jgi:hypothetical protein
MNRQVDLHWHLASRVIRENTAWDRCAMLIYLLNQ